MSNIISTNDQNYQTAGTIKSSAAVLLGLGSFIGAQKLSSKINKKIKGNLDSIHTNADTSQIKTIVQNVLEDINQNKSPQDHIKVKDYSKTTRNENTLEETIREVLAKIKGKNFKEQFRIIVDNYKNILKKGNQNQLIAGKNACFSGKVNTVNINLEKRGLAVFHELGHALNYNNSKILMRIQKHRAFFMFAPLGLLIDTILKRPKADGEKPKNLLDKIVTFEKENVGKLSLLLMLPMFAEECIASVKGNKLAKKYAPQLAKQVKKTTLWAGGTYLATILMTSISIALANKVRDKLSKPKPVPTNCL